MTVLLFAIVALANTANSSACWAASHTLPTPIWSTLQKDIHGSRAVSRFFILYCIACGRRLRKVRDDGYIIGKDEEIRIKFTRMSVTVELKGVVSAET